MSSRYMLEDETNVDPVQDEISYEINSAHDRFDGFPSGDEMQDWEDKMGI